MKKRVTEESILLVSIFKWVILATLIGTIVGGATALFLKLLAWSTTNIQACPYYFIFLPFALCLSVLLVQRFAPEAGGHGTEKVIEAVNQRGAKIDLSVVPVKLLATIITLASGGSAGKEGPCAQVGAGLASALADRFNFDVSDRRKLVICGISAGFASVFGTPIAGAMFGIEVLFIGTVMYDVILPSFIAGVIGCQVAEMLGAGHTMFYIDIMAPFGPLMFIQVILAGIFLGLCALFLIEGLRLGQAFANRFPVSLPIKALIGGSILVCLTMLFSTQYLGLGHETIVAALSGEEIIGYAFALKILFTSITLAFGGSGGVVTPIFFVGATAGACFANFLGLDPVAFAAIGLVGLLAGAANTPLAACILAFELFGPQVAPYAAIAGVTAYLTTGHHSIFPSQVLSTTKSKSFRSSSGDEVAGAEVTFVLRKKSWVRISLSGWRKLLVNLGIREK